MSEYIHRKSYSEQIDKIRSKSIHIHNSKQNEKLVTKYLKNHSYYTLINGYKGYFLKSNNPEQVYDNVSIRDFIRMYYLDTDLSNTIFKYILYIEKSLRSRLGHVVAMNIGDHQSQYLDRKHYKNSRGTKGNTLYKIQDTIDNCDTRSVTKYFKDTKANIPPWIIVQDLSFSTVLFWYDMLDGNLQKEIRNDYFNNTKLFEDYQAKFFYNSLQFLREYRNKVAHGKIHFEEKTTAFIHPASAKFFFNETLLDDSLINQNIGKKDLYGAVILIIGFLQEDALLHKFIQELVINMLPYIDEKNYSSKEMIAGTDIYTLLKLPSDMFQRITQYLTIK